MDNQWPSRRWYRLSPSNVKLAALSASRTSLNSTAVSTSLINPTPLASVLEEGRCKAAAPAKLRWELGLQQEFCVGPRAHAER